MEVFRRGYGTFLLLLAGTQAHAIFNGVRPGGNHPDFPAVAKLVNKNDKLCSAVFVSPTALLTAAHCLADETTGGVLIHGTSSRSELAVVRPGATALASGPPGQRAMSQADTKYDLAVVFFPNGTGRAVMDMAEAEPYVSLPVTLSGWGQTDP